MPVVVVGVDHRRIPLETSERLAITSDQVADALALLVKSEHITEAVVLSTCMRTEIYVEAVRFHGAVADARRTLTHLSGLSGEVIADVSFDLHDDAAYRHLFSVAAGISSSVVGESEVLGQVSRSWKAAQHYGTAKTILSGLFRHALEVGKRARHETSIARGITSIGQAAVAMAEERIGELHDKRVLVLGAGDMGDSMAVALSCTKGVTDVVVASRTTERADALVSRVGGTSVALQDVPSILTDVDLVMTSTGATERVISVRDIEHAMQARNERPLVIVDVAVPRDVEPEVDNLPGVTVLDMENLRRYADAGRAERLREIDDVAAIVEEELTRYMADVSGRTVAPIVSALRDRAEFLRRAEVDRYSNRLAALEPGEREAVEALTKSLLAKLMHDPTVRLKDAAGTPEGERMAEAMRLLYGI